MSARLPLGPANYWELYPWERPAGVVPPKKPRGVIMSLPSWMPHDEQEKQCRRCKQWYLRRMGFHRDRAQRDGLRLTCKNCASKISSARYSSNTDEMRRVSRERQATEEYKTVRKARRLATRDSINASQRQWSARNPDKMSAIQRRWRLSHLDEARARKLAWDAANPLAVKEQRFRRRVKLKNARAQRLTKEMIVARVSVFGNVCAYCREPWSHLDHVIPLSRGGMHCLANLRPACAHCNHRKANRPAAEWFAMVARGEHK